MTTPADLGLGALFAAARRRLRLAWLLATTQLTLPVVGSVALGLVLLGWVVPERWPEPAALGAVIAATVALVGYAIVVRLPDLVVARAIDRGLDQQDAVVTALQVDPANPFADRVHRRVQPLTGSDATRAIRFRLDQRKVAIGLALLAAAVVLAIVRNPADDDRERLAREQVAIEAAADEVAEQAEVAAETPGNAELAEELERLSDALARTSDLGEATEALEAAVTELEARTDADALAERAASLGLSRTLGGVPLAAGATPSEQFANLAADAGGLSDEDLAALAERLAELAATQEAGDLETAAALAEAADAAAGGDAAALAAALDAASASAATSAASAASGIANDQAAADLAALADRLAAQAGADGQGQASGQGQGEGQGQGQGAGQGQGEGAGQGQGQGQGAGQGQGQGSGQGQGQGQGSGQGQGQGGGGGGMQATGDNPSGRGAGQNPDGVTDPTAELSPEHADATVAVPAGGERDVLSADGQATGDGTTFDPNRADGLTTDGVATVPVRDVIADYGTQAVDALDTMSLAPSETEAVQSYFDYLAGVTGATTE